MPLWSSPILVSLCYLTFIASAQSDPLLCERLRQRKVVWANDRVQWQDPDEGKNKRNLDADIRLIRLALIYKCDVLQQKRRAYQ